MNKVSLYRFTFTSPIHISKGRLEYGSSEAFIHSDGLYSAIAQAWAELGYENWIPQEANENWGFVCSSMFPFQPREKGYSYYFPKPYSSFSDREQNAHPGEAKKWKKLEWLDQEALEVVLSGKKITSTEAIEKGCYQTVSPRAWKVKYSETTAPYVSEIQSRNQVGRNGEDTKPFYTERIRFAPNGGLFGLFQFEDAEVQSRVELALRYLASSGLGTDRNVGNGQFDLSGPEALPFQVSKETSTHGLSLSLLLPENKEQFIRLFSGPACGYDVIRRGGWISQPHLNLRKRQVWMIREGAVLSLPSPLTTEFSTIGRTVDLAPAILKEKGRTVWRRGAALVVPIKLQL